MELLIRDLVRQTNRWIAGGRCCKRRRCGSAGGVTAIGLLPAAAGLRLLVAASPALSGYLGVVSFAAATWMNSGALVRATTCRSSKHAFLLIEVAR